VELTSAAAAETTTRAFDALIESGVLGALLVIAIFAIIALFYILLKLMEKRVVEASKWQEVISANTQALKEMTDVERQRMMMRMHESEMRQSERMWDFRTPSR
jgi:hypothetical protein